MSKLSLDCMRNWSQFWRNHLHLKVDAKIFITVGLTLAVAFYTKPLGVFIKFFSY